MTPSVALAMVFAAAGAVMALRRHQRRSAGRHGQAMEDGLDFTIDLIAVVIGSGGTVRESLAAVAAVGPVSVRPVFAGVLRRADDGVLLADALVGATDELGPVYHQVIWALITTERDGAPISILLQRLADEADQARRWRAEAMAKRLPVSLLVPLVVCCLPSVVIGAVVPLAVVAVRQLGG